MNVRRAISLMLALPIALVGCGDSTGIGGGAQLSLSFKVAGAGGPAVANAVASAPALVAGPPMTLSGSNGTLTLDEVRIIINEVELKRADASCSDGSGSDDSGSGSDDSGHSSDDCGELEIGPRFLDLPLNGDPVEAVTTTISAGTYKELDFEIEDLEDDEGDAAEAALIVEVRQEIEAEFPDWPRKASALVVGSFAPIDGSAPVDFRVYLEAEVEIEMELFPNLVVDDAGVTSRDLTVEVSPALWFGHADGSVTDLSLYDFDTTGQLLEFEVEMEDGFTEIEFDD